MKKIIITGATGLIGQKLCESLIQQGHKLIIFTRSTEKAQRRIPGAEKFIEWDYRKPGNWAKEIDGSDIIIHLAGANIYGRRWNADYKKQIYNSRIISTKNLVAAIENAKEKPEVFISSSAVGYYQDKGDEILTESSNPGNDFLATVCKDWEKEAQKAEAFGTRYAAIRTGIVLSTEDGALKKMLLPFKLFIGGPLGNGKQWFPWIHVEDLINIYLFAIENKELNGPINASSPNPVTMKQFSKELGRTLHRPSIFNVPKFALKIAVGEFADSILESLRVQPEKLMKNNFSFTFPHLESALKDLLK